jgi:serine/threonine-protein kinase HipA
MPFARREFQAGGGSVPPFFAGLLPEGARLVAIKDSVKTSLDDQFTLLLAAGPDFVGDVSVVTEGQELVNKQAQVDIGRLTSISFDDVWQKVVGERALAEKSMAGVHQKVSAQMISLPLRGKAREGEFILKLNPQDKPDLVANESFFLKFAKNCRLEVAHARVVFDSMEVSGLLVERFDREVDLNTQQVTKLHVEDACQFLDKYPASKYSVSLAEVLQGIYEYATSPKAETLKCLRLYAFSYLIANGDLHAKNISLITRLDGRTELSPAYDVLSTLPYGDNKMALRVEGRDDNIKSRDLVAVGERIGIPTGAVLLMLQKLTARVAKNLDTYDSLPFSEKQRTYLRETTEKRLRDLSE